MVGQAYTVKTDLHLDGCEVSASCLKCPLPLCKYDDPNAVWEWKKLQRWEPLAKAAQSLIDDGWEYVAATERVGKEKGCIARTVGRALAYQREGGTWPIELAMKLS